MTQNNRLHLYDYQLLNIEHYKKHPQMIPFVGNNYGKKKKLLIIAESHYCPEKTDKNIIENWYSIDNSGLNDEIIGWTNTAEILNDNIDLNRFRYAHVIHRNIYYAINETGFKLDNDKEVLTYISFMNFFQRPAETTGKSIKVTQEDRNVANNVLKNVIDIIKPEFIFFVSSQSWKFFDKELFDKNKTGNGPHPGCKWWNKNSRKYTKSTEEKTITGKESFKYFIKINKIFE